jgi:hypothetical protein
MCVVAYLLYTYMYVCPLVSMWGILSSAHLLAELYYIFTHVYVYIYCFCASLYCLCSVKGGKQKYFICLLRAVMLLIYFILMGVSYPCAWREGVTSIYLYPFNLKATMPFLI